MPLQYNSAGRKLYVLRQVSTGTILNNSTVYPNAVDDAPIVGLDPDLEYLAIDKDLVPDYDPRVFTLTSGGAKEGSLWHITHSTTKKPAEQIKAAIVNREVVEIGTHISDQEFKKLVLLALNVIFTVDKGLVLTEAQTAVKDRLLAATAKLWENDAAVAQLNAAVDADETIDLDTVWAAKG